MQTLLGGNGNFFQIFPKNFTNFFQPLDLSVNKPFKDRLRRGFSKWYTQEVAKQLSDGVNPNAFTLICICQQ